MELEHTVLNLRSHTALPDGSSQEDWNLPCRRSRRIPPPQRRDLGVRGRLAQDFRLPESMQGPASPAADC
jgi:hypothetical protein